MTDKKIGDHIEYKSDRYNEHNGNQIIIGGEIIAFIGDFALIRVQDDNLKAIEIWRIK